jgi:hypothetical protein
MGRKRTKSRKRKKSGSSIPDPITKTSSKSPDVDSADPLDWINHKVKINKTVDQMSFAELRVLGKQMGVKTAGINKPTLKKRVKEKLKDLEKPKIKKSSEIEMVNVDNIPQGSRIEIMDKTKDQSIIITDMNPDPVVKSEVRGKLEDGVIAISSETVLGEPINTQVNIMPEMQGEYSIPSKVVKNQSAIKPVNKRFKKRKVVTDQTIKVPVGRGFKDKKALYVVPRGKEPYEWKLGVPDSVKTIDLTHEKKIILTEKSEIANVLKKSNSGYYVHNLGGNPFAAPQRAGYKKHSDGVRKTFKRVAFRPDKSFADFKYPIISKNAEVIIIADEDYLGQYLSENMAQLLPTENIKIYNIESTSSELLKEVISGKKPQYKHDVNKAIAGAWYAESQAEIGATITSSFTGVSTTLDSFTEQQRKEKKWPEYKNAYLQGAQGNLNITDQELAVMGKVLQEEKDKTTRLKATIDTDLGLQTVEAVASANVSKVDVKFEVDHSKTLNIKNTDQTTMILMKDLAIESIQAEDLIKRLASQNIVSYPRTEYEGISPKEEITPEKLANVWISYNPDYKKDKQRIIRGIKQIQEDTAELPRSGILVLNHSDFKPNTIERKTVESIAKANIWASLGYYEVEGLLKIVDENDDLIGKNKAIIITKDPNSVGKVIDVEVQRRQGMSDKEMFAFISDSDRPLGTTATRTNLIKRLENWGMLLKSPEGEYKLDDRGKIITITADTADSDLTNGNFTAWLKKQRDLVAINPDLYDDKKNELYQRLSKIAKKLRDRAVHNVAETEFHAVSKQIHSPMVFKQQLDDDVVQIEGK